jgi:hypothetical protein
MPGSDQNRTGQTSGGEGDKLKHAPVEASTGILESVDDRVKLEKPVKE